MEIELPTIMHTSGGSQTKQVYCVTQGPSQFQFYAYSNYEGVDIFRSEFRLVNGYKLKEANNSTMIRNFNLQTWECLQPGDLMYKPELQVYFPVMSFFIFMFILAVIYKILIKRLMP